MQSSLRVPRRKRRTPHFASKELLPFETVEKNGKKLIVPYYFIGFLTSKGVEIKDERSICQLYEKGSFGVGSYLNEVPEFSNKRRNLSNFRESEVDSDNDDKESFQELHSKFKDQVKTLHLMFEEAFFLSYGMGCLIVKDEDKELSLPELWKRFCWSALDGRFPCKYVCYHYYRSKGWVVKSGLKYGVDFVLYKDGPLFYHSTYCVIVREVSSDYNEHSVSWSELSSLNRVHEHISKDTLLCYVIKNKDADLMDPSSIPTFTVQEILLRRWLPTEEREES